MARKWDSGQVAFEIEGVAFAVAGMVQQTVDVVEDIPLGDGGVVVVAAELRSSAQSVMFSRRLLPSSSYGVELTREALWGFGYEGDPEQGCV